MVATQNSLYKADTLEMGRGAFQALCDSKGVEVVRSGTTFAVSGYFPVLSIAHIGSRWQHISKDHLLQETDQILSEYSIYSKNHQSSKVRLILPSIEASKLVSIDRAIGLGGGSHEVGHIICDMAGNDLSISTKQKIIPVLQEFTEKKYNLFKVLGMWSNVCADIRLEKMMSKLYPESAVRFHSIQEWIWNDLESKARTSGEMATRPVNCIALMIRDLGKDHKSKSQQRVFKEYATLYPKLWQCALSVKHLWEQLQVDIKEYTTFKKKSDMEKEIEKTVHLPLTIAMQILMSLQLPKEDQQQPPQTPQPPQQPPETDDDQKTTDGDDGDDGTGGGSDQDQNDDDQDQNDDDSNDDDSNDDGQDQNDGDDQNDDDDSNDDGQDQNDGDDSNDDGQDQNDGDDQSDDDQDQNDDGDQGGGSDEDQSDDDQSDDSNDDDDQDDEDSIDDEDNYDQEKSVSDGSTGANQSFDPNAELNLEEKIDPNDIAKAFQKQFDKMIKNLNYKPYISNGLKIKELD